MNGIDMITLPNAPKFEGLRFRRFRGSEDLPLMHAVTSKEKEAIEDDFIETLDDFNLYYKHLFNCDTSKDVLIAEVNETVIGYSRVWWSRKQMGGYNYTHFACIQPEFWGTGLREAILQWNEARLFEISKVHPDEESKEYQAWGLSTETDWLSLLEANGYRKVRYGYTMLRSLDVPIPDLPLPDGLEVRPVTESDYRKVWDADVEASKDGWEPIEIKEEFYNLWREQDEFQPEKWQVAWAGKRVAGLVQNFINEKENELYGRLRGYTENIHVGREWRGQGVAKALIARSFKLLKDMGMEEACLGVDAENPTGALSLYESMGFKVDKTFFTYRKPLTR